MDKKDIDISKCQGLIDLVMSTFDDITLEECEDGVRELLYQIMTSTENTSNASHQL